MNVVASGGGGGVGMRPKYQNVDPRLVALVNRFYTSSVKCWTAYFCIHASKGPGIIINESKLLTIAHSKIHIQTPSTPVFR